MIEQQLTESKEAQAQNDLGVEPRKGTRTSSRMHLVHMRDER